MQPKPRGVHSLKKRVSNICKYCNKEFLGTSGLRTCPGCKKKEAQYLIQRERMRRSLPYYLKTNV